MQCHNIHREPFEWIGRILHKFILPIVVFCVGQLHEYLILLRSSLMHLCMSGACIVVPLFTVAASLTLLCQENFSFVYLLKWAWVYWATAVGKTKTWQSTYFLDALCWPSWGANVFLLCFVLSMILYGGALYFASFSECHRGITDTCSSPV